MVDLKLVGINYAPEPTGIAPYMEGLAEGLNSRGFDVEVITGFPHYPAWKTDADFNGLSICSTGVTRRPDIHRLRHYVPKRPSTLRRFAMESVFAARVVTHRNTSDSDVHTICVSPTLLSAAAVLLRKKLARRTGNVTVWVQDFYGLGAVETGQVSGGWLVSAIQSVEGWVLRNADHVVAIHASFKRHIVEDYGIDDSKVTVIKNWTHIPTGLPDVDKSEVRRRHGLPEDATIVLHAGNMGRKQGLENVLDAARLASGQADSSDVLFVLLGDGNQRPVLEESARGMANVRFLEPVETSEFPMLLGAADILLVNEAATVLGMAVPSKLTSYFASGRPVIAATHEASGTAQELAEAEAGIRVDPARPENMLEAIAKLKSSDGLSSAYGKSGMNYVTNFLTERAAMDRFARLCEELDPDVSERTHLESA